MNAIKMTAKQIHELSLMFWYDSLVEVIEDADGLTARDLLIGPENFGKPPKKVVKWFPINQRWEIVR